MKNFVNFVISGFLFLYGFSALGASSADSSDKTETDITSSVQALTEGIVHSEDSTTQRILYQAVQSGNLKLVKAVYNVYPSGMDFQDEDGDNPFLLACYNVNMDIVNFFAGQQRNTVNQQNNSDITCLHYLVYQGQEQGFEENQKIKDFIENHKVDLSLKDSGGDDVFMASCSAGNKEMVDYFLEKEDLKIDINRQNSIGFTCLHYLALSSASAYTQQQHQLDEEELDLLMYEQLSYMKSMVVDRGADPLKEDFEMEAIPFLMYISAIGGSALEIGEGGMPSLEGLSPEEQRLLQEYMDDDSF